MITLSAYGIFLSSNSFPQAHVDEISSMKCTRMNLGRTDSVTTWDEQFKSTRFG